MNTERAKYLQQALEIGVRVGSLDLDPTEALEELDRLFPEHLQKEKPIPHAECIEIAVRTLAKAVGSKPVTCKHCGSPMFWFPTKNGKNNPISAITGASHFADCSGAHRFRRKTQD